MTATLFSLIALALGFSGLVLWVCLPANQARFEQASELPFAGPTEASDDE